MLDKLPKIIFIILIIFIIFQTFCFLFINLAYKPGQAAEPAIKNPTDDFKFQIPIPNLTLSAPRPCTDDPSKTCYPWIGEYIAGIYKYAIGFVGILATVVMMVGGIMWIVAGGNATRIGEAKSWITAALTGLVLALSSYLILYQINPNLVNFNAIAVTKPEQGPSVPSNEEYKSADKTVRDILTAVPNITINKAACQYQGQTDCTSLANLPNNAILGIKKIAAGCNCSIVITGGTENGHLTHGQNKPIVDIRYQSSSGLPNGNLYSYLSQQLGVSNIPTNAMINATTMAVMLEQNSDTSKHFHIVFK